MREIAEEYNDMVIYPDKVRLNCIDPLYRTGEEDEVCRGGDLRGGVICGTGDCFISAALEFRCG